MPDADYDVEVIVTHVFRVSVNITAESKQEAMEKAEQLDMAEYEAGTHLETEEWSGKALRAEKC